MTASAKEFRFDVDARMALSSGINQLAEIVAMTLGPKGRNVGLQNTYGGSIITSDGELITKEMELKCRFENLGVSLAKETAAKIKEKSGDGTTTGIVLLRALVQNGVKNISAGANPTSIKRGMDKALDKILSEIDQMSIAIKNETDTQNIATVSASGDREIGETIANCFKQIGKSGVITIEEGKSTETTTEIVEGMQIDQGYMSPYFCTNVEKLLVELDHPIVLITDKKIHSAQEILPILQQIAHTEQSLFIIAEDIEGDALSTLVMNKLRGTIKVAAIKAPGFGDQKRALLEDLCILTGATLISEQVGLLLSETTFDLLGSARHLYISKEKTTIVDGKGKKQDIQKRIDQINAQIRPTLSNFEIEKLNERKGKLQGGVAVIKVGALTEAEMKKQKQMFEDSLHATRAALENGIVPGGGMALLRSSKKIELLNDKEEKVGAEILIQACTAPFRQIVTNSGLNPSILYEEVLLKGNSYGFNALTEKIEDLFQAGVIDPVKVVKNSLIHAVSIAGIVLLSEALMVNAKE